MAKTISICKCKLKIQIDGLIKAPKNVLSGVCGMFNCPKCGEQTEVRLHGFIIPDDIQFLINHYYRTCKRLYYSK